jgi:cysteine desulfurase / selenocysteine lyase
MRHNIKDDFPIFTAQTHEKQLVFLDSAAVSQMPQQVIDAIVEFYSTYKANIHSGMYAIGVRTIEEYKKARVTVAEFLSANADEIIFTSSTTNSLNMLARMLEYTTHAGDEIVVTAMDHHSNFIPWQELAKRTGAVFTVIPLERDGTLSLKTVQQTITGRTKIVAIPHVSHVTGVINNVKEICRIAHGVGALCIVDAAQSVPHMYVSVRDIDCDFLAFSGQKIAGPTGIGVLYGKKKHVENLYPSQFGGGMIREVDANASTWANIPEKFEAGTPHIAGAIGLGSSISYIAQIGMENMQEHEQTLVTAARKALSKIPEVIVYGPENGERIAGIVAFNIKSIHPHDVAEVLSRENIAVRAGHHCALPLMKHFGVSGTVRASFYLYNTIEDVERLVDGVKKAIELFRKQ